MPKPWLGWVLLIGLLVAWTVPVTLRAETVTHARIDSAIDEYEVNRDLTYVRTETQDITLLTDRALRRLDRAARTFYPEKQDLEVVEAWVDQPDGSRVAVAKSSIFTRPSTASQSAPGFVNSLTTTVLFPRLRPGSRIHIVWRHIQKTPALLGFNTSNVNNYFWATVRDETRIRIPADVPLHWRARGGFVVEDHTDDGIRHITARIENTPGREEEPAMVSLFDFMPLFLATSLPNAEAVGAIIDRASVGRAAVTPEIADLAALIVGDKTGIEAARAIHAWVAANIRYIAVYLDPDDGWVPHAASDVLKAGYGDCKDYVVLMRALLAARGIEGRMAAIDWGTRYADLPLWMPYANHAILYLPAYDHYLNPTDRNATFDALDRRLSGKMTFIMTPEGQVGRTPVSTPEANRYRYIAHLSLTPEGTIDGHATFVLSPDAEIPIRSSLVEASSMESLAERMLYGTAEGGFGAFSSSNPRDLARPLTLTASWRSPRAVNIEDGDVFLRVPPGLDIFPLARQRGKLSPTGKRQTPVLADVTDAGWEITIALPPGLSVARLPSDIDLQTVAGRYTARYRMENEMLVVRRELLIDKEVIQPEAYPDLDKLIYAPLVDARAIIVLAPVAR